MNFIFLKYNDNEENGGEVFCSRLLLPGTFWTGVGVAQSPALSRLFDVCIKQSGSSTASHSTQHTPPSSDLNKRDVRRLQSSRHHEGFLLRRSFLQEQLGGF